MDNLESKILEILKRGTPLRAVKIAQMLGVERREVNHYLYSSLKHLVVQDTEYKWSLKTSQVSNNQPATSQPPKKTQTPSQTPQKQNTSYSFTKKDIQQDVPNQKPISQSPISKHPPTHQSPDNNQTPSQTPQKQNTSYSFTKKDIQQDVPVQKPVSQPPAAQPVNQTNPYEIVNRELNQVSAEEKVKILETAFKQDRFAELEDEQIYALQSILEEAKREVSIANTAYQQGQLSFWKANRLAIAVVSIALTLGTIFAISQLQNNSTYQPTPTLPQTK